MTFTRQGLFMALIIIALAALIILFGPAACNKIRSLTAQGKLDQAQSEAARNSSVDAIDTQGEVSERQTKGEDLTRSNEKEIRDAKGASDPVDPAVTDAGLRSLCRRAAYRNSEQCRVYASDPGSVEKSR